jgi:hypothetical protein
MTFRQISADQAERAHVPNQLAINSGRALARLIMRREFVAREPFRCRSERSLFFAERNGHADTPGSSSSPVAPHYLTWRRKSGFRFSTKARTPSRDSSV